MKVALGSDHAGFLVKEEIKKILDSLGVEYIDCGPDSEHPVDYPNFALRTSQKVLDKKVRFAILICGSGTGMQIAANKLSGIRAVFAYDDYSARMARYDNDANVLTLRARHFDHRKYKHIVETFLDTEFSGFERHKERIALLEKFRS